MLKEKLIITLSGLVLGLTAAFSAEAGGYLADRHAARGGACVSCHGVKAPKAGAKVNEAQCLKCHGSLDKVAERTKNVKPNPHYNHLVGLNCLECHRGHQKGVNMCADCHNIKFNVP